MRVSRPCVFIALVLLGSTHRARGAENASPDPVGVARLWLEALRAGDVEKARRLSALPITIKGFNLDSGPSSIACGGRPRTDGLVGVRSFDPRGGNELVAVDEPEFEKALRCLTLDGMLIDSIPWPDISRRWGETEIKAREMELTEQGTGCRFYSRCPFAMDKCREEPSLFQIHKHQAASCFLYEQHPVIAPERLSELLPV